MFRATLSGVKMCGGVHMRSLSTASMLQAQAQASKDPIQDIFGSKIREYAQKQKQTGAKLVDATAETQKNLAHELSLAGRVYKIENEAEAEKFPTFSFTDPKPDPINLEDQQQETKKK